MFLDNFRPWRCKTVVNASVFSFTSTKIVQNTVFLDVFDLKYLTWNNNNNNNNAPTPRPRALLPSCFPLELRWNVYFHSLQAVFSSLVRMLPRYCKNHHILMIGSCFFVQYLQFFLQKKCKIVKTCGFFEKLTSCVFSHAIATSHFHGSSDFYVIYNKKTNISNISDFRTFCTWFSRFGIFPFRLLNVKHEWQRMKAWMTKRWQHGVASQVWTFVKYGPKQSIP